MTLEPRKVLRRQLLLTPTLHHAPADSALRLQPAQVRVTVEFFPEDSARLGLEQVQVFADYRQLRPEDSTVQLLFRPLPYTVRGARLAVPTARVLPVGARSGN